MARTPQKKAPATTREKFIEELSALMKKYNAEFDYQDVGMAYMRERVLSVYIPSKWEGDECVQDYVEIEDIYREVL